MLPCHRQGNCNMHSTHCLTCIARTLVCAAGSLVRAPGFLALSPACSPIPAFLPISNGPSLPTPCLQVDHSVGGITHTTGGSTAGYTRWEIFKRGGLASYAAKRNTAMQRNGVSRLSGKQLHGVDEHALRDNYPMQHCHAA